MRWLRDAPMSLLSRRLALLAIPLLALASCGPQGTTKQVISRVDVDNGGQTVKVGGTTKVTLTATLADGKKEDISLLATWATRLNDGTMNTADAFATVDGSGMVKGVAPKRFHSSVSFTAQ